MYSYHIVNSYIRESSNYHYYINVAKPNISHSIYAYMRFCFCSHTMYHLKNIVMFCLTMHVAIVSQNFFNIVLQYLSYYITDEVPIYSYAVAIYSLNMHIRVIICMRLKYQTTMMFIIIMRCPHVISYLNYI